ncbi:MAG: hypothetical protein CM15mP84_10340 [Cellvibrionales bacterium]|nr:MAG: hypothetical protein CM15mP84_10340 [Cellvibrionales bacterium]
MADYKHLVSKHTEYAALSASDKYAAGKSSNLIYAYLRLVTDFYSSMSCDWAWMVGEASDGGVLDNMHSTSMHAMVDESAR